MFAKIAQKLKTLENPLVITHIDADGIASASIILQALRRMGKTPECVPVKQLEPEIVEKYRDREVIFTDLGSGIAKSLPHNAIIIDHHQPEGGEGMPFHLNAHLLGMDGSKQISSSGLAYLVARELGYNDLAELAVVGMVGDLQDRSGISGKNREIVEMGLREKIIGRRKGLGFFGRETRPLAVFLQYASDPYIPQLTGRPEECMQLLESCGIPLFEDNWRTYHDLNPEETKALITAVHMKAVQARLEPWEVASIVREYFVLPRHKPHTELRDATEFATLLNACGRNERPEVGIGVCCEPEKNYPEARSLLEKHRRFIAEGFDEIMENGADPAGKHLRVFWSETIKPTIIGIIIGMGLGSGLINGKKILVGAVPDGQKLKISLRMPNSMLHDGVNLGLAARVSANKIGGIGGGHDIAAGAEIPEDRFSLFLSYLDQELSGQLSEHGKVLEKII